MKISPKRAYFLALAATLTSGCWIVAGTPDFTDAQGGGGAGAGPATGSGGAGGAGGAPPCASAATCPAAPSECEEPTCDAGSCGFQSLAARASCSGGMCDGAGECVECLAPSDCLGGACDGGKCAAAVLWAKRFGAADEQTVRALALTSKDEVVFTGSFENEMSVNGVMKSAGDFDVYVAMLEHDGNPIWAKRWGDEMPQTGVTVAIDATSAAGIILGGTFRGTLDFNTGIGEGLENTTASERSFVAKLGFGGEPLWQRALGGTSLVRIWQATVDTSGRVLTAGSFRLKLTVDGVELNSMGNEDTFLVGFGADGAALWGHAFGNSSYIYGKVAHPGSLGNLVFLSSCAGTLSIGPDELTLDGRASCFARFDDPSPAPVVDGGFGYAKSLEESGNTMAIASDGSLIVAGWRKKVKTIGRDIFLARLEPDGTPIWDHTFGDPDSAERDQVPGLAIDTNDNIYITGHFFGTVNFGGGGLVSAGGSDVFLAAFDLEGEHLFSRRFGGAGSDDGRALAIATSGDIVVAGEFTDQVDFGSIKLTSSGGRDVWVARIESPLR